VERQKRIRRNQRDHSVAEQAEPSGPIGGHPMSQETNLGLSRGESRIGSENFGPSVEISGAGREEGNEAAWVGSGVPPAPKLMLGPPFSPSVERGVDQRTATSFSGLAFRSWVSGLALPSFQSRAEAVGQSVSACVWRFGDCEPCNPGPVELLADGEVHAVIAEGEDEEAFPLVARADFRRAVESRRSPVTQPSKLAEDFPEAETDVSRDVFQEHDAGLDLANRPAHPGPKVARIRLAAASAGEAERLAGIAGSEEMNAATPGSSRESPEIRPDRRRSQPPRLHCFRKVADREDFPLHVACDASRSNREFNSEIETSPAGTEGDADKFAGMIHIHFPLSAAQVATMASRWASLARSTVSRWRWSA
jgi:hypothetical protein